MNSHDDRDKELQRREKELQERERAIRLRELETEIYGKEEAQELPLYQTTKHEPPEGLLKRWGRKLANIAKFAGIVIAVVVAVKIATWLAMTILVGAVGWVAYKIFLEKDESDLPKH
ncbi:MAG: hypothetical protein AB4426_05285 [Xenococcaceae cyanobacterium]